jgi:hypothetical protein
MISIAGRPASGSDPDAPDRYAVDAVRAHFYYPDRGEFDERDLFDPTLVLRNVIGGAADARDPTEITLVLVSVEGPSFLAGTEGEVELRTATVGASPSRQSIPFHAMFSKRSRVTAPFLLHGTGCEKLELELRITGVPNPPDPVKRTIPFHCGE